ncbi:endonuclease III [Candidatus Bathyarchaeota archaeon]|nr:MAG: endonuclease III [Candidatus Bathyarchaeota archaeon]
MNIDKDTYIRHEESLILIEMFKEENRARAKLVLETIESRFKVPSISKVAGDPFKVLVRTIISQSTAEINTKRAYENLSKKVILTPKGLAEADVEEIEEALFVAGLYRNKSRIIKRVSEAILKDMGGSLDFIYSDPLEKARRKLLRLPGVGPKTADILLLFCAGKPVLPVDTHVNRVSKRLGFVPEKAGYEEVRKTLETLYAPKEYFKVHMLFISLGRRFCKAVNPRHDKCPVRHLCPSKP